MSSSNGQGQSEMERAMYQRMQQHALASAGLLHQPPRSSFGNTSGALDPTQQPLPHPYDDHFDLGGLRDGLPNSPFGSPTRARQQPGISAAPAGAMPSNGTIQPSPLPAAALSRSRASSTPAPKPAVSTPKSRGKYRCKKCGQLKKGHVCPMDQLPAAVGKSVPAETQVAMDEQHTLEKYIQWRNGATADKKAAFDAQLKQTAAGLKLRCIQVSAKPFQSAPTNPSSSASAEKAAGGGGDKGPAAAKSGTSATASAVATT
eukprot:INCI16345.4.p2 GENE.INCI16345.4~~INCI16345.4.p2  ORF type:complete len:260 (+),score=46.72 INCI16345.4:340-1119(+)